MPLRIDLGGSWAPFGRSLGRSGPSFGHLWTLFGCFFGHAKSYLFEALVQDELQEDFWMDFGSILEDSGRILEGFWKGLDPFWIDFRWFWEGLANFVQVRLCQDPRAVSRSPAERLNILFRNLELKSAVIRLRMYRRVRPSELKSILDPG